VKSLENDFRKSTARIGTSKRRRETPRKGKRGKKRLSSKRRSRARKEGRQGKER